MAETEAGERGRVFRLRRIGTASGAKESKGRSTSSAFSATARRLKRSGCCKDDLLAGRPKPPKDDEDDSSTLDVALNEFLKAKEEAVERGELSRVQFGHYQRTCATMIDRLGRYTRLEDLKANDFARLRAVLGEGCGLLATKNKILWVRSICKWCYESDIIDRPIKYGPEFKIPPREAIRREKAASGKVGDSS